MAPELGAVLAGGRRGAVAIAFPHLPDDPPRARLEAPQVRRAAMFTGVSAFQMGLIHIIAGFYGVMFFVLSW